MRTFLLSLLFLGAIAARAHADDTLKCEVVEIDATHSDHPSIDPDLKDLEKSLTKGPFAAYNTFKKSARISKDVTVLRVANYSTPHGATELLIRDIDRDAKPPRLSLSIGLDDESGKRYVDAKQKVDVGKFALYARTVSDTESIVTAVGCK
jgi:hypothetical protein